jgi:TolA-binding protein
MDPERLREIRAEMEPPWHDLREQRVLRGAFASRARRASRRRVAVGVSAVVAFVAAIVLVLQIMVFRRAPTAGSATPAVSVLTLADGSRLRVEPRAEVAIESEGPSLVRIVQTAGEVAYDVTPRPTRSFEVRAAGVTVRVLGTAFVVRIEANRAVHVEVTRGRVSVDDGAHQVEIGAGERLLRSATASPPESASAVQPARSAPVEALALPPSASATPHVEPPPVAPSERPPSVTDLLVRADAARASGRLGEAAVALEQLLILYPRDPRATSARFTLGRVARAQGQHAKAAMAFRACANGPLGEDALAEEASSWLSAGRTSDARAAAARYLARFPEGTHAARMRRYLE